MPAIFRVTNPLGETYYLAANGEELTKGEAIASAYRGHPSGYDAEMKRRKKLWSVKHDCREETEHNPHQVEEF